MKRYLLLILLAGFALRCADTHDMEPSRDVKFIENQPLLVNLEQFNGGQLGSDFSIAKSPELGTATIIKDRFLLYTPSVGGQDHVTIEMANGNQSKLLELSLVEDNSACGIAVFDKKSIKQGESISFNLIENDKLCATITSVSTAAIYLDDNSSFFDYTNSNNGTGYSILKFTPSPTFTGSSKIIYAVGINQKDKKLLSAEEMVSSPGLFEYFLVGIAEIEVTEN